MSRQVFNAQEYESFQNLMLCGGYVYKIGYYCRTITFKTKSVRLLIIMLKEKLNVYSDNPQKNLGFLLKQCNHELRF